MPLFSTYSSTLAGTLLPLVDLAGTKPITAVSWVPSPFNLVTSFTVPGGIAGGSQGLLLTATLPIGGQNTPVAVLAFGTRWDDFCYGSRATVALSLGAAPSYLNLGTRSDSENDGDTTEALIDAKQSLHILHLRAAEAERASGRRDPRTAAFAVVLENDDAAPSNTILAQVSSFYGSATTGTRAAVWAALPALQNVPGFGGTVPLLCVGMGPGATLAQIAALDLRPGQTGPAGSSQVSPASEIGCYAFSAIPFADAVFAQSANAAVSGIYPINAPATDLWGASTGMPSGITAVGVPQSLTINVATSVDTPWYDRTPAVYGQAYGGAVPASTGAGALTSSPAGFDPRLASTFAQLTTATYVLCQHSGASVTLPAPYSVVGSVSLSGASWTTLPWAILYKNGATGELCVVIRGPATYAETVTVNGNGYPIRPTWMTSGRISDGVIALTSALQSNLAAALAGQDTSKGVYYVGHDYGASAAAALAYQVQVGGANNLPAAKAIYGFGAQPFADYILAYTLYPGALGAKTFQVQRPSDILTQRVGSGVTYVVPTTISLTGGDTTTANSTTYHAASLYTQLLNAWAG